MVPPATVTGRISLAESSAQVKLQDVTVVLSGHPYGSNVQVARSNATGMFAFAKPVRPDHYLLRIESPLPDGCFLGNVKLGGQEISAEDFELSGSAQLDLILSNTAGKITGSVSDADGNPFPVSTVTLIPTDGKSRPAKQSLDEKGNFSSAPFGQSSTSCSPGKKWTMALGRIRTFGRNTKIVPRKSQSARAKHRTCDCP